MHHSVVRIFITSAEPDIYSLCRVEDFTHNGDLKIAFLHIILVNAYRVNPDKTARKHTAQSGQDIVNVTWNRPLHPIDGHRE